MLPVALSEVLGISLSEVMERYFDGSEESVQVHRVEEALDCHRTDQDGEEWLAREAHHLSISLECSHQGEDDMF
jgi:hypothetical protein